MREQLPRSSRRLAVGVTLLVLFALAGCKDDKDPVGVPFKGIEVSGDQHKTAPPPAPTATATATAKPKLAPHPPASRIGACCGALQAAAKSSSVYGDRRMNAQAAKVCYGLRSQVIKGKLKEAAALAQVRSSLLGKAPSACH